MVNVIKTRSKSNYNQKLKSKNNHGVGSDRQQQPQCIFSRQQVFTKTFKKKNEIKAWETIVVSDNLTWEQFSKVNNYLYELVGVKTILSISRIYPFKENYTHVLGYVSQPNENDILANEIIQEKFVPGIKGTLKSKTAFFADNLSPITLIEFESGPTNIKPSLITLFANSAFSDRNP